MGKKTQAVISLTFTAIGAGLVYVSYNNYISISADDPYTQSNSISIIVPIVVGLIVLALGLVVLYDLIKGSKKTTT